MLLTGRGFFLSPAQANPLMFLMATLGISDGCGSFAMKRKLLLCFIYNHFSRVYEKQLEGEAMSYKTEKELFGLIPSRHGVLQSVIWGVNQSRVG